MECANGKRAQSKQDKFCSALQSILSELLSYSLRILSEICLAVLACEKMHMLLPFLPPFFLNILAPQPKELLMSACMYHAQHLYAAHLTCAHPIFGPVTLLLHHTLPPSAPMPKGKACHTLDCSLLQTAKKPAMQGNQPQHHMLHTNS